MARFDPNTYPDRLAFEAHIRRIRAREIDRIFAQLGTRLRERLRAHGNLAPGARHSQPAH
jgi:hypothetical protein